MPDMECNYQRKVSVEEFSGALKKAACEHCGVTSAELLQQGEILEVCGEEFASDIESGQRLLIPIALCPDCHRNYHLDARHHHNPCQIKARLSREGLD